MTTFKRCCAKTTFSTLLHYDYFFHADTPCTLFPHCCAMATFSTLLCHIYSFHHAAPCLLFPRCCAIISLSTLLCCVFFFHAAALCLLFPCCCAMTSFSMIDRTTCEQEPSIITLFGELLPCSLDKPIPNYRTCVIFFFNFDHLSFQ